jgi:hypothetical protein
MLRKGWRNDVIHFYFNKPDRLISPGRMTQIKKGKYGASVEEALPDELEVFLSAWEDSEVKPPPAPSSVDMKILRSMFIRDAGSWRVAGGETHLAEHAFSSWFWQGLDQHNHIRPPCCVRPKTQVRLAKRQRQSSCALARSERTVQHVPASRRL